MSLFDDIYGEDEEVAILPIEEDEEDIFEPDGPCDPEMPCPMPPVGPG